MLKSVALKVTQVLLRHIGSNLSFVASILKDVIYTHLEVSSVDFRVKPSLTCLYALSLYKLSLALLFIKRIAFGEDRLLIVLDHFDASLFNRFANKNLEDRFNLHLIVEKVWFIIINLDSLIGTFLIRDVSGGRWPVDKIVCFDIHLVFHVVEIV